MLTTDMKRRRVQVSQELLTEYRANPESFLGHLVIQDETRVHHFDPETKTQSMQWKHKDSLASKKFKVAASVFWDAEGVIMVDYLQKGQTINGEYYAHELRNLREAIKNKRRGKLRRVVLLLQNNAPAHTDQTSLQAAANCGFRILPHPACSPDLAPSDFYLFPNLKTELRKNKFQADKDVIEAVEGFLEQQETDWYRKGLLKLEERRTKCIELRDRDYVEK